MSSSYCPTVRTLIQGTTSIVFAENQLSLNSIGISPTTHNSSQNIATFTCSFLPTSFLRWFKLVMSRSFSFGSDILQLWVFYVYPLRLHYAFRLAALYHLHAHYTKGTEVFSCSNYMVSGSFHWVLPVFSTFTHVTRSLSVYKSI